MRTALTTHESLKLVPVIVLLTLAPLAGCAGVTDSATVGAHTTASPTPTAVPSPSADPGPRASQVKLSNLAQAILDVAAPVREDQAPDIDGEPSGYAGVVINNGSGQIDLYWKGELPVVVQLVLDKNSDVVTNVYPALLNVNEAQGAQAKILTFAGGDGQFGDNVQLASIGTSSDFSAVEARFLDPDGDVDVGALSAKLTAQVGIPVRAVITTEPIPVAAWLPGDVAQK